MLIKGWNIQELPSNGKCEKTTIWWFIDGVYGNMIVVTLTKNKKDVKGKNTVQVDILSKWF